MFFDFIGDPVLSNHADVVGETGSSRGGTFATTVDVGGASLVSHMDCVVMLDAGATADLVHFS